MPLFSTVLIASCVSCSVSSNLSDSFADEPAHRLLEDRDAQGRVAAQELTGGPQAAVAAADDGDVDVAMAAQRGAGYHGLVQRGPPQRSRWTH